MAEKEDQEQTDQIDVENQDQEDGSETDMELAPVTPDDLMIATMNQNPSDFAGAFDALLKDKISDLVAQKKLELADRWFGAPEGLEQPEGEVDNNEKGETELEVAEEK
jgi:hypothetical protein